MADSSFGDLSPEMQALLAHTGGDGIVVTCVYEDGSSSTFVPDDDHESVSCWQEEAFTNGPRLLEVRIRWAPDEAKKLTENAA